MAKNEMDLKDEKSDVHTKKEITLNDDKYEQETKAIYKGEI